MILRETHLHTCLCVIIVGCISTVASTTIQATAPLNPVKEGDILSLRCQIWNLASNQAVKMSRHAHTGSRVFSYDKGLITGMDERVFLAVRQLRDGSTVYFLSIIDVQQNDEGQYSCKVMDKTTDIVIAKGSVNIKTMFFPAENSPSCDPSGPVVANAGSDLRLNCSSEKAHPPVNIEWKRAGADEELSYSQESIGSIVYSVLTIKPKIRDRDAMFFCKITSEQFPEETRTCHVGPLTIVPNEHTLSIAHYAVTKSPTELVTSRVKYELDIFSPVERQRCQELCRKSSLQSIHFWVICTGVAGVFAIVFFIVGVVLLIKYRNTSTKPKVQYVTHHQGRDDVYTELEMRQDANKVYMAITKPPDEILHCPKDNEGVYEQHNIEPPENKVRYV